MPPDLLSHAIDEWVDPAAVAPHFLGADTDVAWLDSGVGAVSGRSYLGRASRTLVATAGEPFLPRLAAEVEAIRVPPAGDPFALGWVGWLGYELRYETLGLPRTRESRYPDAAFLLLDAAIEFDHSTRGVRLVARGTGWTGELAAWRQRALAAVAAARASAPLVTTAPAPASLRWSASDEQYLAQIAAAQAAIVEGEAYQLCLTRTAEVATTPDPLTTYLALRESSPSHHGGYLRIADVALLSASPETFLSLTPAGVLETRPIKGTRPRSSDPGRDAQLAAELAASEKERAENLMIVDLMRNDLGRVCRVGSVEVPALAVVESYAHVHQLVSSVRGQLADGIGPVEAVAACFPAGSMTGAPKRRATQLLDDLERAPRGIYSGAFGYFAADGRVDLAMVIRSIVLDARGATVGSGGGITAPSVPAEELAEVALKAAAPLAVLGAAAGTVIP